jgi:hypothetical protein
MDPNFVRGSIKFIREENDPSLVIGSKKQSANI